MAAQRKRILEAAIACIAETGVEHMSIEDVRKAAGLSGGTIYLHFANKEELALAAVREFSYVPPEVPRTTAALRQLMEVAPIETQLTRKQMVRASFRLLAECLPPSSFHSEAKRHSEQLLRIFSSALETIEKSGEAKLPGTPKQIAKHLIAMQFGMGCLNILLDEPVEQSAADISAAFDHILGMRED